MGKFVFNAESGRNEIIGPFYRAVEDTVEYSVPGGAVKSVAADCVTVREVTDEEIRAEIDRFIRQAENLKRWVVPQASETAMNSLVALGVEMTRYAQVMGAALGTDAAHAEVRRKVREGYFIEARAHSRALEAVAV